MLPETEEDVKDKREQDAPEESSTSKKTPAPKERESRAEDDEQEEPDAEEQTSEESTEDEASDADEDADGDESESEESEGEGKSKDKPKKHERMVPYSRFQKVNRQLQETQARVERVEQSQKKRTWDDLNVDELKHARSYYRDQKDEKMVSFIEDKILDKRTEEAVEKRITQREFKEKRRTAWIEVVQDYPELANEESDHFQQTKELVDSDPRYGREPEGYALAARLVAERLLREERKGKRDHIRQQQRDREKTRQGKKEGLEGGGRPPASANSSLAKLEQAAVDSGSPHSKEWRAYLKALRAQGKG